MRQREKGFVNRVIVRTGQGNVVYTISRVIFEVRNDGPRTEEKNLLIYIYIYIYRQTHARASIYNLSLSKNQEHYKMANEFEYSGIQDRTD